MQDCPTCGSSLQSYTFGETYCGQCHRWYTETELREGVNPGVDALV